MSDYFKKFIETSGKSLDEIKKIAEKMAKKTVKNVAKTVLDEAEKTVQQEIRRKIQEVVNEAKSISENTKNYPKPEKIPERSASEKNVYVKPPTLSPDEIAYPHESLPDSLTEQETRLVEKIGEMRKLREMTYNGYIVQRCAEVTFVLQGDFMADVTDDFPRTAFCAIPTPMYAAMSISQLRTYFTWRTDARRGIYRETDKPYVLLYAYELLNKIGVLSSEEAFGKLLDLWDGCSFAKYLNTLMPRWLKDFYAFNDISNAYPDINIYLKAPKKTAEELACEEITNKIFQNKLAFLADNSAYNIIKSSFYSEETKPLLNGAAEFVLNALDRYFTEKELDLCTLLGGQMKKDFAWKPFEDALVNLDREDGFHAVKISAFEQYCIRHGEPVRECFSFTPKRGFIGYILKSIESRLRVNTGFKRKIVPNENMLEVDFINREKMLNAVKDEELPRTIQAAVDEFCQKQGIFPQKKSPKKSEDFVQYAKKEISIDVTKLQEIREKSEEIAKKLIVEETVGEDYLEQLSERISDEDFDEKISEFASFSEDLPDSLHNEQPQSLPESLNSDLHDEPLEFPEDLPEEWRGFFSSLTKNEREILAKMCGGKNADAICREKGLLPETVFEEINNKAMDYILDIVIENSEIIPDYLENIKKAAL